MFFIKMKNTKNHHISMYQPMMLVLL
ncbi:hypothetical protein D910_09235 [Dendroctonus ponderosae]|uniref:Uncharacterized protein n=1 Tax=Dendroctonus ponderosae TaxID=77166 RepID=U4UFW9_DENPD|nr:hypothetical protein D910_09235 [Dendroctonus ponderosae]